MDNLNTLISKLSDANQIFGAGMAAGVLLIGDSITIPTSTGVVHTQSAPVVAEEKVEKKQSTPRKFNFTIEEPVVESVPEPKIVEVKEPVIIQMKEPETIVQEVVPEPIIQEATPEVSSEPSQPLDFSDSSIELLNMLCELLESDIETIKEDTDTPLVNLGLDSLGSLQFKKFLVAKHPQNTNLRTLNVLNPDITIRSVLSMIN